MKTVDSLPVLAAVLLLAMNGTAHGSSSLSYEDTVAYISKTMADHTSVARKESYAAIKFDRCLLSYKVAGTFPVGTPYVIKFSDIDFAGLNYQQSYVGQDYTDFMVLNFRNQARYRIDGENIPVNTVVVNTSDSESAQQLFRAFLHLGELCGAGNRR